MRRASTSRPRPRASPWARDGSSISSPSGAPRRCPVSSFASSPRASTRSPCRGYSTTFGSSWIMSCGSFECALEAKRTASVIWPTAQRYGVFRRTRMDITLETASPEKLRTGVLVVGAFADGSLPPSARMIDEVSQGKLSALMKRGDLEAKAGASLLLYDLPGAAAERVLLVSLGTHNQFGDKAFRDALGSVAKTLAGGVAKDAAVALADLELPGRSLAWRLEQASCLLADGAYRFDAPGTRRTLQQDRGAHTISLLVADKANPELERAVRRGQAVAEGLALTKDLGNLGGNVCNPDYLAHTAQALGQEFKFAVDVLERDDMEKLGMGSALSVGRASYQPCKFIVM